MRLTSTPLISSFLLFSSLGLSACGETETSADPCKSCVAPEHGKVLCEKKICGFTCDEGYIRSGDQCVANNTAECCGAECRNCAAKKGVSAATCAEGRCVAESCAAGYHLAQGECALDSRTACGAAATDCTKGTGVAGVDCIDGACKAFSCLDNFHPKGGACEADSATACGLSATDCTAANGVATASCVQGRCKALTCDADFHLKGITCAADTGAACGANLVDCGATTGVASATCEAGVCKALTCGANYHLDGNACVLDSKLACGAHDNDCTALPGVGAVRCSAGACVAQSCKPAHHLSGATCVADSATSCGAAALDCTSGAGVATASCVGAACVINTCIANYHVANNACAPDTVDSCGAHQEDCYAAANVFEAICENGACRATECELDFHPVGANCVADTSTACGPTAVDCTVGLTPYQTAPCESGLCSAPVCKPGMLTGPDGNCDAIAELVGTGDFVMCAILKTTRALKCWGRNEFGALGNDTTTNSSVPVQVVGATAGVKMVAPSTWHHSCMIDANDDVYCWGQNQYGGVGDNTTDDRKTPVKVNDATWKAEYVGVGQGYTVALTTTGGVKVWGDSLFLYGFDDDVHAPVDFKSAIGGFDYSSGVSKLAVSRRVFCIGVGDDGVICYNVGTLIPIIQLPESAPDKTAAISKLVAGSAGGSGQTRACATMASDNSIYCWGFNTTGQNGNGTETSHPNTAKLVTVFDPAPISSMSIAFSHSCAVVNGGAKCWGTNTNRQLGNGTANSTTPLDVIGFEAGVAATVTAYNGSCVLTAEGAAYCWGRNAFGVLGCLNGAGDANGTDTTAKIVETPTPLIDAPPTTP